MEFGSVAEIGPGHQTYAVGFPIYDAAVASISRGILSREEQHTGMGDTILTDAAINPGNSGGPLLNECGRIVGMTVSTLEEAVGLNYAIAETTLTQRITELGGTTTSSTVTPPASTLPPPVVTPPASTLPPPTGTAGFPEPRQDDLRAEWSCAFWKGEMLPAELFEASEGAGAGLVVPGDDSHFVTLMFLLDPSAPRWGAVLDGAPVSVAFSRDSTSESVYLTGTLSGGDTFLDGTWMRIVDITRDAFFAANPHSLPPGTPQWRATFGGVTHHLEFPVRAPLEGLFDLDC